MKLPWPLHQNFTPGAAIKILNVDYPSYSLHAIIPEHQAVALYEGTKILLDMERSVGISADFDGTMYADKLYEALDLLQKGIGE